MPLVCGGSNPNRSLLDEIREFNNSRPIKYNDIKLLEKYEDHRNRVYYEKVLFGNIIVFKQVKIYNQNACDVIIGYRERDKDIRFYSDDIKDLCGIMSQELIARLYDTSQTTISNIMNNK